MNYISLNLDYIYDIEFENFWVFFYSILGFCFFSILIVGVTKSYTYFSDLNMCLNIIPVIFHKLLPVIANILFIPSIMACLLIFKCRRGIGDYFTDSFLENDCNTFCWKD